MRSCEVPVEAADHETDATDRSDRTRSFDSFKPMRRSRFMARRLTSDNRVILVRSGWKVNGESPIGQGPVDPVNRPPLQGRMFLCPCDAARVTNVSCGLLRDNIESSRR